MFEAWNLRPIEIFYLFCTIIGGLLFLIRGILFALGGGDTDVDADAGLDLNGDIGEPGETGMRLVSIQGISGFFLMLGLVGLAGALRLFRTQGFYETPPTFKHIA